MASYNPAFDTVVSREAAWFTVDPPPTFPTAPPLLAANGGPFDICQGYYQRVDQRARELYIVRTGSDEDRDTSSTVGTFGGGMGGMKGWKHTITLYLFWAFEDPTGSLEAEQQNFDSAMAAVMTRIRGPFGDKSHNQAFASVGEGTASDRIQVRVTDVRALMDQGQPLEAQIIYSAYDTFVA